MSRMPIFDDKDNVIIGGKKKNGNVVIPEKRGRGRPKKETPKTNTPKIKTPKIKTQFTFIEYLRTRLNLSFIAQMFKEATATIQEWDMMVQNLADLLKKKTLEEEK